MTRGCWGVLGLLLLVPVVLLAGCAAWEAYRGAGSAESYVTDVPPAFRDTDPALRHWYTAALFQSLRNAVTLGFRVGPGRPGSTPGTGVMALSPSGGAKDRCPPA